MQNRLSLFVKLFWNVLGLSDVIKCVICAARLIALIVKFSIVSARFK
jgi:hypothetical protein